MHRLRSRRRRFAWIRRRAWVLAVTTILVVAMAVGLTGSRHPHYTSVAVLVVQSGASHTGPGSANEAATLGVTYAGLIPQDSQLVRYVAGRLGLSTHDIEKDVSVSIQSGTSLLLVNFTNPSASVSLSGAQLVAEAISGPTPVTATIPAGSVALVHLPTTASRVAASWHKAAALGLILGLALGAGLIVLWERIDARIDDAVDLLADVRFPVWDAEDLEVGVGSALLPRWRSMTRRGHLDTVALIALGDCLPDAEQQVAQVLREAATATTEDVARPTELRAAHGVQVNVIGFDPASLRPSSARSLVDADFRVLLVPSGFRHSTLLAVLATLAELDIVPAWAFVLAPPGRREQRARLALADRAALAAVLNGPTDAELDDVGDAGTAGDGEDVEDVEDVEDGDDGEDEGTMGDVVPLDAGAKSSPPEAADTADEAATAELGEKDSPALPFGVGRGWPSRTRGQR